MVFSRIPRSHRLILLAIASACATATSLTGLQPGLVASFTAMFLALAIRNEIRLNELERRYSWYEGIWPLMGSRRGSFADFRWVYVEIREQVAYQQSGATVVLYAEYSVYLDWQPGVGARSYQIFKSRKFVEAAAVAIELAKGADISVVESADLRKLRPTLGPAAYDERLIVPIADRPASLAARLRR